MRTLISLAGLLLSGILAGCASAPPLPDVPEEATLAGAVAIEVEPEEIDYGSFTEDQLYQAIISELGAQRGQVEDASENYFDLAMATRDLNILRRAVQFASVTGDMNALMQLGLLWSDPSHIGCRLVAHADLVESGHLHLFLWGEWNVHSHQFSESLGKQGVGEGLHEAGWMIRK